MITTNKINKNGQVEVKIIIEEIDIRFMKWETIKEESMKAISEGIDKYNNKI